MSIANLKSKSAKQQQKPKQSSLRERALQALDKHFKVHGEDAIQKLCETRPDRYVELATRPTDALTDPFDTANSHEDIARALLKAVGFDAPDDNAIQAAIEARDAFIAQLEAIKNAAESGLQ